METVLLVLIVIGLGTAVGLLKEQSGQNKKIIALLKEMREDRK
ncbi:hypothetical protein [Alteribacter aurantiacus]|nr:hypothetical protein [Alteribacter aurantiacus]